MRRTGREEVRQTNHDKVAVVVVLGDLLALHGLEGHVPATRAREMDEREGEGVAKGTETVDSHELTRASRGHQIEASHAFKVGRTDDGDLVSCGSVALAVVAVSEAYLDVNGLGRHVGRGVEEPEGKLVVLLEEETETGEEDIVEDVGRAIRTTGALVPEGRCGGGVEKVELQIHVLAAGLRQQSTDAMVGFALDLVSGRARAEVDLLGASGGEGQSVVVMADEIVEVAVLEDVGDHRRRRCDGSDAADELALATTEGELVVVAVLPADALEAEQSRTASSAVQIHPEGVVAFEGLVDVGVLVQQTPTVDGVRLVELLELR